MPKRIAIAISDNYLPVTSGSCETSMDTCTPMNHVWKEYPTTTPALHGLASGDCTATWHGFGADGPNMRNYVAASQIRIGDG